MEELNIKLLEISVKDIKNALNESIEKLVHKSFSKHENIILIKIEKYFERDWYGDTKFERQFQDAFNLSMQEGIEKAIIDLDLKNTIAEKSKIILSDNDFISKLAEQKIRNSLGLSEIKE